MLEGGADIRYVSEMLGHAKLETTALYTRVSIAKLRAVHAATHPAGNDSVGAEIHLLRSTSSLPKSS
jgi:integrase/recombinase XerD